MMRKKKYDPTLLAQGINGIADLYVELQAKVEAAREELAALSAKVNELARRLVDIEREDYRSDDPAVVMQEYCYGKRGDRDE